MWTLAATWFIAAISRANERIVSIFLSTCILRLQHTRLDDIGDLHELFRTCEGTAAEFYNLYIICFLGIHVKNLNVQNWKWGMYDDTIHHDILYEIRCFLSM